MAEYEKVRDFDPDALVVAMIEHKGLIFVATTQQIFRVFNDELYPLKFIIEDDKEALSFLITLIIAVWLFSILSSV